MNPSPLVLVKTIRAQVAAASLARSSALSADGEKAANAHWETFDAAVDPLIDALIEAEQRGMIAGLETLLTTLRAQASEAD